MVRHRKKLKDCAMKQCTFTFEVFVLPQPFFQPRLNIIARNFHLEIKDRISFRKKDLIDEWIYLSACFA